MSDWFLPYTAAALVAAALGWLALEYDPDAGRNSSTPVLAGAPAPGKPATQQAPAPAPAPAQGSGARPAPAPAPAGAHSSSPVGAPNSGEAAAVRQLVTTAMTTSRPADCTRLYTQAFLEQISGDVGYEAIDECRDNSDGDGNAKSIAFNSLADVGSGYRVAVDIEGGSLSGSVLTMTVLRDAGNWKIDRLLQAEIDMEEQARVAGEALREEGYSEADIGCVEQLVREADEAAYERAVLEGRSTEFGRSILDQAFSCLSAEAIRKELTDAIRDGAGPDAPEALVQCVINKIVGGKSAAELREIMQMEDAAGFELGRRAAAECAQMTGAVS